MVIRQLIKMNIFINVMKHASSFETFFKEYYSSFCFFANRYVKDTVVAESIVADVALKVWERRDELKNSTALKSYFYSSVRNACLNYIDKEKRKKTRKAKYVSTIEQQEPSFIENIIRTETLAEVEKAVYALPAQCQRVFIKLFFEGKSLSETAQEMKLSVSTIKNQRLRGIKLLRGQLTTMATVVWAIVCFVM